MGAILEVHSLNLVPISASTGLYNQGVPLILGADILANSFSSVTEP